MRHDPDLLLRAGTALDEQAPCGIRHDDHELSAPAQSGQHSQLVRRRLREHRVQGRDQRLRQLLRERQHVLTIGTAEDAVLVLQEHDVDVEPAEHPCGTHVVAADALLDRRQQPASLRTRSLVDDRYEVRAVNAVDAHQGRTKVGCERADPARTRRIRGNNCRAHALPPRSRPRGHEHRVQPLWLVNTAASRGLLSERAVRRCA